MLLLQAHIPLYSQVLYRHCIDRFVQCHIRHLGQCNRIGNVQTYVCTYICKYVVVFSHSLAIYTTWVYCCKQLTYCTKFKLRGYKKRFIKIPLVTSECRNRNSLYMYLYIHLYRCDCLWLNLFTVAGMTWMALSKLTLIILFWQFNKGKWHISQLVLYVIISYLKINCIAYLLAY